MDTSSSSLVFLDMREHRDAGRPLHVRCSS
eukprot:SAG11_NODE_30308_length_302_cov_0.758621_1_plen_29_part_10